MQLPGVTVTLERDDRQDPFTTSSPARPPVQKVKTGSLNLFLESARSYTRLRHWSAYSSITAVRERAMTILSWRLFSDEFARSPEKRRKLRVVITRSFKETCSRSRGGPDRKTSVGQNLPVQPRTLLVPRTHRCLCDEASSTNMATRPRFRSSFQESRQGWTSPSVLAAVGPSQEHRPATKQSQQQNETLKRAPFCCTNGINSHLHTYYVGGILHICWDSANSRSAKGPICSRFILAPDGGLIS